MNMRRYSATLGVFALATIALNPIRAQACPTADGDVYRFSDGSIGTIGGLEVDTDGAAASYSPGDHGFSYIADGVNRLEGEKIVSCIKNQKLCNTTWTAAEKGDFGPGTPRFCSFAIAVEPWRAGQHTTPCRNGKIIGDGLGRPRLGAPYPAAAGGFTRPYDSETSLHQWIGSTVRSIDLGTVPAVVVPTSRPDLLGTVVWVRYGKLTSFAIVADTGPSYHEGSLALHQILQGNLFTQPIGPILADQRCNSVELAVKPPFHVRPLPKMDECSGNHRPQGPADIRASGGIASDVHILILGGVRPTMTKGALDQTPTADTLANLVRQTGYTDAKLAQMDSCLR